MSFEVLNTKKLCYLTFIIFKWDKVFFFSSYVRNFAIFRTLSGSNSKVEDDI
jgi:hypothetical protein